MNTATFRLPLEWKRIFILSLISFTLLGLRIKISQDYFLLFLVWNLFLAMIPYLITYSLYETSVKRTEVSKIRLILGGLIWLAFFPNAPYIITDLIHIQHVSGVLKVYEALLISSFAVTGMYVGFLSLRHYSSLLLKWGWLRSRRWKMTFEYLIILLSSFGIYLGRVLRYNSWDIIYNLEGLFTDSWALWSAPLAHSSAWVFILGMCLILILAFHIFNIFNPNTFNSEVA